MNVITSNIRMDFVRPENTPLVYAVQGERLTRRVELELYCDGEPWIIPETVTPVIRYGRIDLTGGYYDTLPDGTPACSCNGNTLTILLAPQMMSAAGAVLVQAELLQEDAMLATFAFQLMVALNPAEGIVVPEDYINWTAWMQQQLREQTAEIVKNGDFTGPPGPAGESASVRSWEVTYQSSSSSTVVPTGVWSSTIPNVSGGQFLWTRTTLIFNDGTPITFYSVARMGLDGSGSVSSVSNISPDSNGNILLAAENIGALPTTGGTMTGELNMNGNLLSGLTDPSNDDHAARKAYVDCQDDKRLNLDYITDDAHIVPSGADLNNFTTPGVYRIPTSAIMAGLKNTPGYTSAGAKLIVCATSATNTGVAHFMIFNSKMNRIFYRVMASDTGWGEWVEMASKEDIYPVGAIYMSVNSTSPASLFGGTWTQLKDRFLLGAGSTYSNGATGGAAAVTLTLSQIPSHTHDLNVASADNTGSASTSQVVYGKSSGTNYTNDNAMESAGGGTSHSNMPPYLVVYMWKRTA